MTVDMLTVADVAERTRLSAYTIRAAVRAGELRATKLRGQIRVHPADLAAWIDDGTVRPDVPLPDQASQRRPRPAPPSGSARDAIRARRGKAA